MGTLLIARDTPSFDGAIAHVWIEAAAPADARAEKLAETRLAGLSHRRGEIDEIGFTIPCPAGVSANDRLRAWVDVKAGGVAAPEDLYSTEAVTVSHLPCVVRVERSSPGGERKGS